MKNIKLFIATVLISSSVFISCEDNSDSLTGNQNVGGFIAPNKKLISYVIGNGDTFQYKNVLTVDQSQNVKVVKINIYKYFVDTRGTVTEKDDRVSNEVLFRTFDVDTNVNIANIPYSVTYPQLIANLKINNANLSADDTTLFIGDYFLLRYEQVRSDGAIVESSQAPSGVTKVAVGTRLAGTYRTVEAAYYRIGVLTAGGADWPKEIVIESVDATNYKIVGSMGYFPPTPSDPNNVLFVVNGSTISYSPLQLTGNSQPFITCTSSSADFNPEVNCGTSNKVVFDNVNGADKLFMTFGYKSANGPRVFYQVLEKIVN